MSGKSSVGNVGTKWDTKLSGSEGKKDGVEAYFLKLLNRIVTVMYKAGLTWHTLCSYNCIGL